MTTRHIESRCTHKISKMTTYGLPDDTRADYWQRYQALLEETPGMRTCEARTRAYHEATGKEAPPPCPSGCRAT